MQDKETKKRFENFVTEECGDSLWGNDGTDNYDTAYDVKDKVWDFISKLEHEAERRGARKELEKLKLILNDCVVYINDSGEIDNGVIGSVNRTIDAELKLLEEENGKQNAR